MIMPTERILEQSRERLSELSGKGAFVFKLGGSVTGNNISNVNDPELAKIWSQLAQELVFLLDATGGKDPIVVVHGGGKAIDAELIRQNITPQKIAGRRLTDEPTMQVVEEVLSRQINPALVAAINQAAGREVAIGIAGSSVIRAEKATFDGVDLGCVGTVTEVNTDTLLEFTGKIVVVSPTGRSNDHSRSDGLLNINGDDAASAVAVALHKAIGVQSFVAATDVPGVLDGDKNKLPIVSVSDAALLQAQGVVKDGMIPKLQAAFELAQAGIGRVRFVDGRAPSAVALGVLPESNHGTQLIS